MNAFCHSDYQQRRYHVSVGFTRVEVTARSIGEAIEQARSMLCAQMPRFWDVIQSLDGQRFVVHPLP